MKANDTRAKGMVFNQKAGEYIQELEAELVELREAVRSFLDVHDACSTETLIALLQGEGNEL